MLLIFRVVRYQIEMAPRGRPVIDFTSTYTADYSSGGRGRSGRPTRSLSAAPTYRPSAGSVPTSGRPSTRSGGVSRYMSYLASCTNEIYINI